MFISIQKLIVILLFDILCLAVVYLYARQRIQACIKKYEEQKDKNLDLQENYVRLSGEKLKTELSYNKKIKEIEDFKQRTAQKIKYLQETNEDLEKKLENFERLKKQDDDFQKVYNLIMRGENVFITGGAGTGKSYILRHLKEFIPDLKNNVTSTTGISAINIEGVTINSWAKFKINLSYDKLYNKKDEDVKKEIYELATRSARYTKKAQKDKISKTKILAVDEISMLSDYSFMFLDYYFQILRGQKRPFGGIQMVLIGDFCQLPPVITDKNPNDKSLHYAFLSESWQNLNLKYVLLKTFHRQEKDIRFAKCLNDLRLGKNIEFAESYLSDCIINYKDDNRDLIHVYSTNKGANNHNLSCLDNVPTERKDLFSENYFVKPREQDGQISYNIEKNKQVHSSDFIRNGEDKIEKETKAPDVLSVKIGCKVMVTKNLDVEKGIANGSMGYVTDISDSIIYVDFAHIKNYPVPKEDFVFYDKFQQKYILRRQFPLILAYAITIHKSQGLTFEDGVVVAINNENLMNAGQAYVALSRVGTKDKLHILNNFPKEKILVDNDVVNFYENLTDMNTKLP